MAGYCRRQDEIVMSAVTMMINYIAGVIRHLFKRRRLFTLIELYEYLLTEYILDNEIG